MMLGGRRWTLYIHLYIEEREKIKIINNKKIFIYRERGKGLNVHHVHPEGGNDVQLIEYFGF